jgi:DNA-binding winged helix-turn-helix (wHTH) protein/TolB-like protein
MSLKPPRFYEFDAFRLDRLERRLSRKGETVSLAPRAMDVLLTFVENAERVLDRAELIKRVWPDSDGAEASLAVTISSLRKSLGDRPDGGLYIETIPRQGYRFAVSVSASDSPESTSQHDDAQQQPIAEATEQDRVVLTGKASSAKSEPAHPTTFLRRVAAQKSVAILIAALAVGIAVLAYGYFAWRASGNKTAVRRLAILPFRNLRPDEQTDFLGPSLADATTTMLRNFSSLIVRPSSYANKYRGKDVDPKTAAEELNVDTLITGTFLKEANSLRVTVQLIDVTRGEIISRFPFETKYDRLVTVQDQVARNIIERLHLNLSPEEAVQLRKQTTDNPLAYEYFLRGTDTYSRNEFLAAVPLLEKAVELDPNFAIAWAHLGRAYNASASFNLRGRELQLKSEAAYEQALALNPNLIEATIFMANLFTDSNRAEKAVPILRKLLQANPNIAEARWELGYAFRFAGMLKESIAECERARLIDPNVKRTSSAPNSYLYTGQYEKFLSSLPQDDNAAFLVFYRGLGNYYLKRFDQAAADFDRAYDMDPQLYTRIGKALSYTMKNQRSVALEELRDVEREIEQKSVGDAEAIYKVAQVYAALEEKRSGLRVLRRSIQAGFFCYDYFKSDPLLENLRDDSEFAQLLEQARERQELFRQAFF